MKDSGYSVKKDIALASGIILLRPYGEDDAQRVHEAAMESVGEAGKWLPWCHAGYTLKDSRNWIKMNGEAWEKGTAYEFAVMDYPTGGYLGGCGLNHVDTAYKTANLGYWIRTGRTGQGAAPAAALLLARFGFEALRLNRIEIIVAVENAASRRVAEKIGAKREGILRSRIPLKDGVHDAVMFSLIPQDLNP